MNTIVAIININNVDDTLIKQIISNYLNNSSIKFILEDEKSKTIFVKKFPEYDNFYIFIFTSNH